jgi:hypothetical protein
MESRLNTLTLIAKGVILVMILLAGTRIVCNVTDALIDVENFGVTVVADLH